MALTQAAVDEFLAADKVVRARVAGMQWREAGVDTLRWRGEVEVEGVTRGTLWLQVNRSLPSTWNLQLDLHGESVLMWHFKSPVNHRNVGCPNTFPRRVKGAHEHVWVEGLDMRCARELEGIEGFDLERVLQGFLARTNIRSDILYRAPGAGEQIAFGAEEAEQ
jgi:hypothetical protein